MMDREVLIGSGEPPLNIATVRLPSDLSMFDGIRYTLIFENLDARE